MFVYESKLDTYKNKKSYVSSVYSQKKISEYLPCSL